MLFGDLLKYLLQDQVFSAPYISVGKYFFNVNNNDARKTSMDVILANLLELNF